MGAKNILTETVGDVEWIIFNRPEKLNSMTREDLLFISKHLNYISTNKNIRAVIFTGSGDKAFSAGMDFNEFNQLTPQDAYLLISDLKNVCQLIRKIPQPVIMGINGYCIGGAMEMCMAADIKVAAKNAVFSMPEINLGIPSVLDSVLLQQHVGLSLAKEMLLTGEPVNVEKINQFGFLNAVVEKSKLKEKVKEYADTFINKPYETIKQQKELFETWQNSSLDYAINDSMNQFALAFTTEIPQQRLEGFISKRK
ncbi:enoyl-CoA hydratase [Neobacillus bataviensis LMG 21833]|uniref:Enoyl-CoA hydratase n=1 Tax=Neobacillus bataviensis LMG 21833 TaxID=1117379 RepID=K6C796_9BACI|nr:enoyl-CoA hydratase/isomerase family protein [Neobacillus bataviensis]EKN66980.1 enoyl-CoA hydratase [Neobacillus bataviensis LMG 21833]